ncbi:MAG: flagellar filament capping protein FliD [Spirochaetaceae bacterium]|jgi:flagellar hook-associated protein 2|nr:flagellar filament capping protein FliD [Spirochaetaceae bacterium]
MSDIYVPGVKSRFSTEKLVEDLMRVERLPKDRAEKNIETYRNEKTHWQDLGRRINSLRDSARQLFSFQNPFSDRIVVSRDDSVISGTATREALEQERNFTVKQIARADRFLSVPLEDSFKVDEGTYTYAVGRDEISFTFRGGSIRDFVDTLNRRGRDKIHADIIAVQRGAKSLLIESLVSGAESRLSFSGDAEKLAIRTGMAERIADSYREVSLLAGMVTESGQTDETGLVSVADNTLTVAAGGGATIPLNPPVQPEPSLVISFEITTNVRPWEPPPAPQQPPGPAIPGAGSVTYGGITLENDPSSTPIPPWTPPPLPKQVDDLRVLSLGLADGTASRLPAIEDSRTFKRYQYPLSDFSGGKAVVSVDFLNRNTNRDVSIRNIRIFDPDAPSGLKPRNPVSIAQDAVIFMDGIEIQRPSNRIDDLIPGVTLTVKTPSDRPVTLGVEPDREGIKEGIFSLVGNYNRLMAEVNVLTRTDERVIEELSYLSPDEQKELRDKLGKFAGDSTLNQFKNTLQQAVSSPYPTLMDQDLSLLTQIGIGTDVRKAGATAGYDASRLRGYLEIDERVLDIALQDNMAAVQQFFGNDTDGDLIIDSGVAYAIDRLAKPYVETGGLISLKTGTIDSRIDQTERRIDTMDRQLSAKEVTLKNQYAQMEEAYNRMEQMSTSLEQFSQQSNNNR